MAAAVTSEVGSIIEGSVAARGEALLALPGGSTPHPVFERLALARLPWPKVTIIPGDDRLVSTDSALSNVAELARAFSPTGARVVPIASDGPDYREAGSLADAVLQNLIWPPDLVWLGMGMDGHTASIFPGPDLENALNASAARRAIGVMPDPLPTEAPVPRVTLTKSAILSARSLLVTLRGQDKRELIERAVAQGTSSELPIGRVLAGARQPVHVHWCS